MIEESHGVRVLPGSGAPFILWVLLLSLAACGGGGSSPPGAGPAGDVRIDSIRQDVLAAVNAARSAPRTCGTTTMPAAAPLAWDDRLATASLRHSMDMASRLTLSHTGSDGSTPGDRITGAGYAWQACGEDIASGQPTVADVVSAWMASSSHCAIIMGASYTDIGAAYDTGSNAVRYWTLNVAQPR